MLLRDLDARSTMNKADKRMTAYRVVTAERKDIIIVTIICDECGSEVSINIETAKIPDACPSCSKAYGEKTASALAALGRFHRDAATAESHSGKPIFRFNIKQAE